MPSAVLDPSTHGKVFPLATSQSQGMTLKPYRDIVADGQACKVVRLLDLQREQHCEQVSANLPALQLHNAHRLPGAGQSPEVGPLGCAQKMWRPGQDLAGPLGQMLCWTLARCPGAPPCSQHAAVSAALPIRRHASCPPALVQADAALFLLLYWQNS